MNDWIMLVTALGGIEGIKQLVKWWMSRKTNARIEDAHADVEEFQFQVRISLLQCKQFILHLTEPVSLLHKPLFLLRKLLLHKLVVLP